MTSGCLPKRPQTCIAMWVGCRHLRCIVPNLIGRHKIFAVLVNCASEQAVFAGGQEGNGQA